MSVQDILFADYQDTNNDGGFNAVLYVALVSDIASMPGPIAAPATNADYGKLDTGEITFNTGKNFAQVQVLPDSAGAEIAGEGSMGSVNFGGSPRFRLSNLNAATLGFAKSIANKALVIGTVTPGGEKLVWGSTDAPAFLMPDSNGQFGNAIGDDKQIELVFRATQGVFFYDGSFSTTPAV